MSLSFGVTDDGGPFAGHDGDGSKGYTGENMQAWFDEIEGRYYVCATQKSGASQTWSVQPGFRDSTHHRARFA
jgi:hypothetical protein